MPVWRIRRKIVRTVEFCAVLCCVPQYVISSHRCTRSCWFRFSLEFWVLCAFLHIFLPRVSLFVLWLAFSVLFVFILMFVLSLIVSTSATDTSQQGIYNCLTGGASCPGHVPHQWKKLPHQCSKLAHQKFFLNVRRFIISLNF